MCSSFPLTYAIVSIVRDGSALTDALWIRDISPFASDIPDGCVACASFARL
jgi:hypothetical protein